MDFSEALKLIKQGKKLRRKVYTLGTYIFLYSPAHYLPESFYIQTPKGLSLHCPMEDDLLADDWEVLQSDSLLK